jgi:anti-sigma factor RsiW
MTQSPFRRWRQQRHTLTCREAADLLSDQLDGLVPSRVEATLAEHLLGCADCTRYGAQLRAVVEAAGRPRLEPVTEETVQAIVRSVHG